MVGAVLVRGGVIIAEGFHEGFGKAHAERQLLEKTDLKISTEDVLYVNLEPCCHTGKKTPPCAQFIVEKGVKTVVVGMVDPNPSVSGKGIAFLRSHGVEVIGPVLPEECARLNRGFVSLMTKDRPWITLKSAQTVDGRHANPDGSPLKITSTGQDAWAHQFLRARHDAILVGVGTILADDPRLDVRPHPTSLPRRELRGAVPPAPLPALRLRSGSSKGRGGASEYAPTVLVQPYRIILDPHFRIPLGARVVSGELARGTIVVIEESKETKESPNHSLRSGSGQAKEKLKVLKGRGVRVLNIPKNSQAFDWLSLWQQVTIPKGDFYGITSILVEGGQRTWEVFRREGIVDEEVTLVG